MGLLGHSDADVLVHAIMDAMLGAAGLGDIGQHFPDTDPRYKGISSLELLNEVDRFVKAKGYLIGNIDSVIMAERPKLMPHMHLMRERIAETLDITLDKINIKATTTEKLGFVGREEGIAAQAVVYLIY
jgi:2-C-methyl-D-erythritol 2,4-cyclodiphosphate synthase